MQLKIEHQTRYSYDAPVPFGLQQLRLTPQSGPTQTVDRWNVAIEGGQVECSFEDQHGNLVQLVSFEPYVTEFAVTCNGEVSTLDGSGISGEHRGIAPLWMYQLETPLTAPGPGIRALIKGADTQNPVETLHQISGKIAKKVRYEAGTTGPDTTAEEALQAGNGVCQDHAQIFIAAARLLGLPARYVSGYLRMNDRIDQDATHAWAEAFVEDLGWVGFDVSNGISPDQRYVRVAAGADYSEAAPASGLRYGDATEALAVSVQVQQ